MCWKRKSRRWAWGLLWALPRVPGLWTQGHGASHPAPLGAALFPSCKLEGVMCEVLPAQGLWGPFLYIFLFCAEAGSCSSSGGAETAAAGRPPAQRFKFKRPRCLPPAWGPRSPRCFTTPASRPGGFLWATLPHWAPLGRVRGLAGRCGTPSQGHLGQVEMPAILSWAGKAQVGTGSAEGGPERGGRRADGAQESGASKPVLLDAWEPGRASGRAPRALAPEQREGGPVNVLMCTRRPPCSTTCTQIRSVMLPGA